MAKIIIFIIHPRQISSSPVVASKWHGVTPFQINGDTAASQAPSNFKI